ncbi:hypothetical protein H1D32_12745 [Anaerobacillus sp. CMMVII]|uniref:hypothetical protein n=1 Tax=Anaerobacillus sp. CMMVII TaxID=2755588 RepID=UPI0021B803DD|nr:hypothetical protein [Anaerobacillus sp. CMMVII]MCT8138531.1 hypothetical protein [Anaerobacillus sp. CMMVII]
MKIVQNWYFLGVCLMLAVLVEVCIFTNQVGVSYSMFIALFYVVFFLRFRKVEFQQKQISGLLFFSIGVLTISFFVYSNPYFNQLNSLVIPFLCICSYSFGIESYHCSLVFKFFFSLIDKKSRADVQLWKADDKNQ